MKAERLSKRERNAGETVKVTFKWIHANPDFSQYKMLGFGLQPQEVYLTVEVPKIYIKSQWHERDAEGVSVEKTELTLDGMFWVCRHIGDKSKKVFLQMAGRRDDE